MGGKVELRWQFWLKTSISIAAAALGAVTLLWRDWIEIVFHVDPDHHSGRLEWVVVAGFALVALTAWYLARSDWRIYRSGIASVGRAGGDAPPM
jgi:hypothetical protein